MSVWKVILATLVIFSTGAITGTLVGRKCSSASSEVVNQQSPTNRPNQRFRPDRMMRRDFMRRFGKELELSTEQTARIESILRESQERTRELWEQVAPQMHEEFQATQEAICEVLTPEQRKQFEELMMKRRRPRDRDPGEGPPDAPRPAPPPPQ